MPQLKTEEGEMVHTVEAEAPAMDAEDAPSKSDIEPDFWHYQVVSLETLERSSAFASEADALSSLGVAGWELVSVVILPASGPRYYMKRRHAVASFIAEIDEVIGGAFAQALNDVRSEATITEASNINGMNNK